VNIDLATKATELIKKHAATTRRPEVLSGVGFFGGMFEFKGYRQPVLVSSTDSVGTKLKIATSLDRHDTIGIDIVNHCVNDILTCGAEPLFFLDYIGIGKLLPEKVADIVKGVAQACRDAGCALIGGETAEMPGIYHGEDYDLVGFVIGVVEKDKIISGEGITVGDAVIGLPSSGLHTNGYSLVRRVFGDIRDMLEKHYAELGRTLGEELLVPHRCYYPQLKPLLPVIKGMAHITGGGLVDNIPRILPQSTVVQLQRKQWAVPPIFPLIQQRGNIDPAEMDHVFNMGLGMVVICAGGDAVKITGALPDAGVIGEVVKPTGESTVVIE